MTKARLTVLVHHSYPEESRELRRAPALLRAIGAVNGVSVFPADARRVRGKNVEHLFLDCAPNRNTPKWRAPWVSVHHGHVAGSSSTWKQWRRENEPSRETFALADVAAGLIVLLRAREEGDA